MAFRPYACLRLYDTEVVPKVNELSSKTSALGILENLIHMGSKIGLTGATVTA